MMGDERLPDCGDGDDGYRDHPDSDLTGLDDLYSVTPQ
jgi:hypothetical protein